MRKRIGPERAALLIAESRIEQGRFAESAAAFDALAKMLPDRAPHLWQRGLRCITGPLRGLSTPIRIAPTVNPDDVENAAWHFLCVAREQNPEAARASLLPVGPDPRVPMRRCTKCSGRQTPEAVMRAAGTEAEGILRKPLCRCVLEATGQRAPRYRTQAAAADRYEAVGATCTWSREFIVYARRSSRSAEVPRR